MILQKENISKQARYPTFYHVLITHIIFETMAKPEWAQRQTYTPEQLHRYFDRIALPQKARNALLPDEKAVNGYHSHDEQTRLNLLATLQRYQVAAVPFENLNLHYSTHHSISIDAEDLFYKIVDERNGRGGYCMENNGLFGTVLRSLGYNAYSVGARVNEAVQPMAAGKNWKGPKFDGW